MVSFASSPRSLRSRARYPPPGTASTPDAGNDLARGTAPTWPLIRSARSARVSGRRTRGGPATGAPGTLGASRPSRRSTCVAGGIGPIRGTSVTGIAGTSGTAIGRGSRVTGIARGAAAVSPLIRSARAARDSGPGGGTGTTGAAGAARACRTSGRRKSGAGASVTGPVGTTGVVLVPRRRFDSSDGGTGVRRGSSVTGIAGTVGIAVIGSGANVTGMAGTSGTGPTRAGGVGRGAGGASKAERTACAGGAGVLASAPVRPLIRSAMAAGLVAVGRGTGATAGAAGTTGTLSAGSDRASRPRLASIAVLSAAARSVALVANSWANSERRATSSKAFADTALRARRWVSTSCLCRVLVLALAPPSSSAPISRW